jgi:hypothetical protein
LAKPVQGYRIFCGAIFEKMMFSLPCANFIFMLACCLNRHAVAVNDVNTRDGKFRLHICALGMNFGYKYRKKMRWLILSFVILCSAYSSPQTGKFDFDRGAFLPSL